jgi:hypothetical protein
MVTVICGGITLTGKLVKNLTGSLITWWIDLVERNVQNFRLPWGNDEKSQKGNRGIFGSHV